MKDTVSAPALGKPPDQYSAAYFSALIRNLEIYLAQQKDVGPIRVSAINIANIPTASTDLRSGDIWSNAGVLTIVA